MQNDSAYKVTPESSIYELNLTSGYQYDLLHRVGIVEIGDILKYTEEELRQMFPNKSIEKILHSLREKGFELRKD